MKKERAAGIVLYNPDIRRLEKSIQSIYNQVEKLFLADNCSANIAEIEKLLSVYPNCRIIKNDKNRGIAAALNQLMEAAEQEGYAWLLTLDDDSVCDPDMMNHLMRWTKEGCVGIVCARAVDEKKAENAGNDMKIYLKEVQDCITAGSLTRINAWRKIGGFDEKMFIDFVDIEYCTRLRENGYCILQVTDTCVHQQYGNISGSFNLFGKVYYLFNYSPVRVYYSVRNQIYYMKKHKSSINTGKQLLFLTGYISKRLLFEKQRLQSLKAVYKGVKDGVKM